MTTAKLLDRLSAKRVQAATTLWIMDPAMRAIRPQEALAAHIAKVPATLHDAAALEAFNKPLSRFQQQGGSAETEALILADFEGRTGLFARPVLVSADLVEYYGVKHFRTLRFAATMLGEISLWTKVSQRPTNLRLHIVHDDPRYLAMSPTELRDIYFKAKGL